MIDFSLGFDWPWKDTSKWAPQKDYVEFDKVIPWLKNKAVSFQVSKSEPGISFSFTFRFSFRGQDHAGLYISIHFWKYWSVFDFYDIRHWNYDKNEWYPAHSSHELFEDEE